MGRDGYDRFRIIAKLSPEIFLQVASWGAYLLSRDILTMSFAPSDNHEAQVQFALERGVPALIGIMASKRLPYPSRAFDMAHCSRCLIPWTDFGTFTYLEP
ncbi:METHYLTRANSFERASE PMT20-RELATED [Salix purpurea]|uniref:Methyltransferase n=1 Tax=Salix purpurea TaxID=77065 RepID=A0A9Q1A7N9_SALPP|nr:METHYLTRANSFERASE PMT20-RELATED [Salix purpurea]